MLFKFENSYHGYFRCPVFIFMVMVNADVLILKAPITTAADDSLDFYFHCFSEKIRLDILCESSARQRIHMKHQTSFSTKDKIKKKSVVCYIFAWLFRS